jgi:serine-type D-Ala-D-Ala carboxypeptidase (penicillin-binding protein 5/6)
MAYARATRRRRRRWPVPLALLVLLVVAAGVAEIVRGGQGSPPPAHRTVAKAPPAPSFTARLLGSGTAPWPLAVRLDAGPDPVHLRFKHPPRAGLLFDVDTGRVLWRRQPTRALPIASLTKMMTALVVDDRVPRHARVKITRQALAYQGSGVGVLPKGKQVKVEPMLYGLLLPSGNDAAIALAQRAAGTVPRFVRAMNARARLMGLVCSHFTSPSGFYDAGNHSCASDLAMLARAILRVPRLAKIVRTRQAVMRFPIKGGKLYLYNNNPLLRLGYKGTTGVKTGYTDAAGRCLVATARRGDVDLGVVLLHSPDTGTQATKLLNRGFRAEGV